MSANSPELKRGINLYKLLQDHSYFLFGPRGTGKSFMIRQQLLGKALYVNLLHSDTRLRLLARPAELEEMISGQKFEIVVIDEIQKVPDLLNEVHRLMEEKRLRFLLTGSSARKLKHSSTNLLAGRALNQFLHPLTTNEIPNFKLEKYLQFGGLPKAYLESKPAQYLSSYCKNYLEEEIQAEGWARSIPQFFRFLKTTALTNGQMLNFTKIAQDAQVKPSTIRNYYSILEDTLIGKTFSSWQDSKKRKAIETAKFYFFDIGVVHSLAGIQSLPEASDLYGKAFEHFIYQEIQAYLHQQERDDFFGYWRTKHDTEVDFIIGDHTAVEAKATKKFIPADLKGLKQLKEEKVFKNYYLVSRDSVERKVEGIWILPWKIFCERLWAGELF